MAKQTYTLITGATGGIGEELCRQFARHGHNLILTSRSGSRLEKQARRLRRAYQIDVKAAAMDLREPDAPRRLRHNLRERGLVVDILVNNAGFGLGGCFIENDPATQVEMIRVNIMALTQLCRLFAPAMAERGRGGILNIASLGSFVPGPFNAVYCATKAYVLSLTEALAEELAPFGVSVTAVCPGATASGFAGRAGLESAPLFRYGVMSPKDVAAEAYRAFAAGKRVAVVGGLAKAMAASTRLVPRIVSTKVSKAMQRPAKQ